MPLYLAFWGADLLYAPQYKWEFLGLRLSIIPACLLTRFFIFRVKTLTSIQLVASIYTGANSAVITVMIFMMEGGASPYYAGLNLVGLGMGAFIPWSNRFWYLNLSMVYLPYVAGSVISYGHQSFSGFILNSFFMMGTIVITTVIRHYNEKLTARELESRLALQSELQERESVIKKKTQQETNLRSLTRQFSPQVVQAISSGRLDIHRSIHRARICAIFVDIVNSTERIIRLDKDALNRVLSMYMEDTMKVLLKYDITIDKFLGDGVLAFANDPVQYPDYVSRAASAALEIRARIEQRQQEYIEYWLDNFEIRVGIDVGYANVGFYGNDTYLKSYTAIGTVMNLANRLCSNAKPNQILITNDVAKELSSTSFVVASEGTKRLKGFEADLIKVFELKSSAHAESKYADVTSCPSGHGVLHLENNAAGIYVLKCRICDFEASMDNKSAA